MTREELYRAALERIANPIADMQRRSDAEGAGTAPVTQELPVVTVDGPK